MADTLKVNERLEPGQSLQSANGFYTLFMQDDGNLVLYEPNMVPRWSAASNGPIDAAVLQADGNFVVYRPGGEPAFSAGVWDYPGGAQARLVVQNDRNLVLYSGDGTAKWHTQTWIPMEDGRVYKTPADPRVYVIQGGQRHHIPDPYTLEQGYGGWQAVEVIPPDQLDRAPEGAPVPAIPPDADPGLPPTGPEAAPEVPAAEPDVTVVVEDVRIVVSLTSKGLDDAINGANDAVATAQIITTALAASGIPVTAAVKLAIDAVAVFVRASAAVLRALDRGRGVYITAFWPAFIFAQFIIVPTPR